MYREGEGLFILTSLILLKSSKTKRQHSNAINTSKIYQDLNIWKFWMKKEEKSPSSTYKPINIIYQWKLDYITFPWAVIRKIFPIPWNRFWSGYCNHIPRSNICCMIPRKYDIFTNLDRYDITCLVSIRFKQKKLFRKKGKENCYEHDRPSFIDWECYHITVCFQNLIGIIVVKIEFRSHTTSIFLKFWSKNIVMIFFS